MFSFNLPPKNDHVSLLGTLGLKHLVLRNNDDFHARNFLGLSLATLDLRGLSIETKRQVIAKGVTDIVIVSEEKVSPTDLNALQKNCKVVFKP